MLVGTAVTNAAVVFIIGFALGVPVGLLVDEESARLKNGRVIGCVAGRDEGDDRCGGVVGAESFAIDATVVFLLLGEPCITLVDITGIII